MRRSLLTGMILFSLSVASFGRAGADELPATPSTATTVASPSVNAAYQAESVPLPADAAPQTQAVPAPAPGDAALPTAGADLSMWNAGSAGDMSAAAAVPGKHVSRLRRFADGILSRSSAIASSLTRSAMRFIGTPYVFGGSRPGGFDCSGYVQHVFALIGLHLPRTADAQYDAGHRIVAAMVPGDLVFFHTYAPGVSHVGIYLGNDKFIHSSSSHGVSIASLHDSYWAPRYLGAKRIMGR